MSTEDPHAEAPAPPPEAAPPPPPSAPETSFGEPPAPRGPSTNTVLIAVGVVAALVLLVYFVAQNGAGNLFNGSTTSAANYTVQPYTPTTELITASEGVTAHAHPDMASPGVVIFGQGVTVNVNGRVSRGLGDDWYAIAWNNQRAFVRASDIVAGTGAPPTPAEHQVQAPREKPDEDVDQPDEEDEVVAAPEAPSSSLGMNLSDVDWIRAPSARDFARFYPDRALDQGRSGRVVLDCTAQASGRLDCSVAEESPPGYRFGQAALSISRQVRIQPQTPDGRSVAGGHLTLPLNFRAG